MEWEYTMHCGGVSHGAWIFWRGYENFSKLLCFRGDIFYTLVFFHRWNTVPDSAFVKQSLVFPLLTPHPILMPPYQPTTSADASGVIHERHEPFDGRNGRGYR